MGGGIAIGARIGCARVLTQARIGLHCFLHWFALVLHWFTLVCIGLHWFTLVCIGLHWFCIGFAMVCIGSISSIPVANFSTQKIAIHIPGYGAPGTQQNQHNALNQTGKRGEPCRRGTQEGPSSLEHRTEAARSVNVVARERSSLWRCGALADPMELHNRPSKKLTI